MQIMKTCWGVTLGLSIFVMSAHANSVQPKNGGPPSSRGRADEAKQKSLANAKKDWSEAMEKIGDPTLLFSFGIDGGGADRAMGLNLTSDELAFTQSLVTQMNGFMMDAYIDTRILDIDQLSAIQKQKMADLKDAGLETAIGQIMREVKADMGIVCQFTLQPDKSYRANMIIIDPRSGRSTAVSSWTVNPNAHSLDSIAAAMFEELADRMLDITSRKIPRLQVLIVGDVGDKARELRKLSRLIADLDYVETSARDIDRSQGTDVYTFSGIRYDGYGFDLGYEVADLLMDELGIRADVAFSDLNVTLKVYEHIEAPAWHVLTSEKENPNKTMFEALYRERGSPRVAVVTIGRPNYSRAIEDNLAGMMMNAGVDIVDAGQTRNQIGSSGLNMGDEKILESLRDLGGFDVLVLGEGQTIPGALPRTTYRAMMVETGRLLGTSSWPSQGASEDPDYGVDLENPDVLDVSRYLAGSILDMFMRNHLMKDTAFDIRVEGVSSYSQARLIATSIESVVPGVSSVSNIRFSENVANFKLEFSGDIDELMASLQESISSLPIETKIDSAGPGSLKMRAKKLEADG